MVILEKQSTSKYDSMGDSIWLTRQGKCASSAGIVWFEWFFSKWKGILKIELQKYMAEMKNTGKVQLRSICMIYKVIDVLLVNKVFLGYFDTWLVGMNCHTKQCNTRNTMA